MRTRVVVGIGVAAVLVAGLIAWRSCGGSSSSSGSASGAKATAQGSASAKRVRQPRGPVKPASLAGRVLKQSDGTGIPGAVVAISRTALIREFMPSEAAAVVVVTDAQGAWTASPVQPGTYFVAVTATGFLPAARAKLVVDSGDAQTGIDITLAAGGSLVSGTVTDVLGGPIADARITAKVDDSFRMAGTADYVALTKGDGTYQLTLPDGKYSLRAEHDEYTDAGRSIEVVGATPKIDFTLTPGAVIRGQVIARDTGKPVPGAWILAEGGRAGREGGDAETGRADDQGNFVLRGLGSGALSLKAQGKGYASTQPTVVELGIGEQADGVKILVDRAYSVYGTVVRKGKPDQGIAGVQLGLSSIGTQQYGMALEPTDDSGAFEIHGLRAASYMLFAGGEGNVPEIGKPVEVVDRDVEDVVVELAIGATLAGRVEPPRANVRLTLEKTGEVGLGNMFEAFKAAMVQGETDASGAFKLSNAPAGGFTVIARADDGATGKLPLTITDADQSGLAVKLETRASISGRVVDDKGAAVAGAQVDAQTTKDGSSFSMSFSQRGVASRADGSFKVVGLEAGSYRMHVRDGESRFDWDDAQVGKLMKVELTAAQQVTGITLTVEARDGVIRGQVIGGDRKPVADAWVTASRELEKKSMFRGPDGEELDLSPEQRAELEKKMPAAASEGTPSKPVLTGADGRFTIQRLKRGTYKLIADGPKGTSHGEVNGIKTGSSTTINLLSLGSLAGKVTVDRTPITKYDLDCDGPGEGVERHVEAADGAYSIDRLRPGTYTCEVTADAGFASAKIEMAASPLEQDFALERYAIVTGKVVDVLTKKPVGGLILMAMREGGNMGEKYVEDMMTGKGPKTNADGTFTLPRIPAGGGTLQVMGPDIGSFNKPLGHKEYKVKAGERLDLGTIEIVKPREGDAGTYGFAALPDPTGKLKVTSVKEAGPAAIAGLKEGDVITAMNGQPVAQLGLEVAMMLISSGTVGVGQTVKLTLERGGEVTLVSVKW